MLTGGALLAAMGGVLPRGAIAGPFAVDDDQFPIPADKKWDARWVRSLFEPGGPAEYRKSKNELTFIGFPVGGICCGQVYLSGDGRLWHWDIFNLPQAPEWSSTAGPLYAKPARPAQPFEQGLSVRIDGGDARPLDATGFEEIAFKGRWPIAEIEYTDPGCPVVANLEVFSPFSPLDVEASGLPATLMRVRLRNTSAKAVEVEVAGTLANAACIRSGQQGRGWRVNRVVRGERYAAVACGVEAAPVAARSTGREDVVIEDFEKGTYKGWAVTGTAFGATPRNVSDIAEYQGDVNAQGRWLVNSHETRTGDDVGKADTHIGSMLSDPFVISRDWLSFRIGGGNHPGQTCVNLVIDGAPVRTATGRNDNRMRLENWDVRQFAGREARLQILDGFTGGWGQIGCDDFVLTDQARTEPVTLEEQPDFGTMALAVLGGESGDEASPGAAGDSVRAEFPAQPVARVSRRVMIEPGAEATVTFVYAWHFAIPPREQMRFIKDIKSLKRHYAAYADAMAVVDRIARDEAELGGRTRLWRDTWYDSTLPHWFLDRTMANTSTLATSTCHLFDSGRFYAWEGTHCCAGTCAHVWHYAQAVGRLFPVLERSLRERVDFGAEFDDDTGIIHYRGEAARELAVDGQAGAILRALREHQMSRDDAMLRRIWPRVKRATRCLLDRDIDGDGLLDGAQYNTLDATWWGKISWLTSMFLAAVRAAAEMAEEMGDAAFARECRGRAERGSLSMVDQLFNGEYFIHITDPAHPESNSTGTGCHIDQLLGQFWAHQVGLPRIVPMKESISALRSLYTYSVAPDIGPYRRRFDPQIKGGRWYAMPGEGGLLMCTWPKGGSAAATGKGSEAWAAGYFNECMSGFEHQVAAHMIGEGLVLEGLAVTRLIHDRYDASRRNPWNEVECSNHYARAMASYGSFVAACGFEHHGPRGHIGFAPKIAPEKFASAFVACEGWGRYAQQRGHDSLAASIELRWGLLRLRTVSLDAGEAMNPRSVIAAVQGRSLEAALEAQGTRVVVRFKDQVTINAGETLTLALNADSK